MVAAGDTRLVVADILRVAACRRLVEAVDGDRLRAAHLQVVVGMDRLRAAHLRVVVDMDRLRVALRLKVVVVDGDRLRAALQGWALRAWVLMRLLPVDMVLRRDKAGWADLDNASSLMATAASCSASCSCIGQRRSSWVTSSSRFWSG